MTTSIQIFKKLRQTVKWFYAQLKLNKLEKKKGRKLALSVIDILTLALFKQRQGISTKKSLFEIFRPRCSYKTLVVNINRFYNLALIVLLTILKINQKNTHVIKHTDSTNLPVCLPKNARRHKTMNTLASWGKTGKGWFYGLKLHITTDLKKRMLAVRLSSGNVHDSQVFMRLNKDLDGVFIADAGYCSTKLQDEFYQENKRILLFQPKKNMKKLISSFQYHLYNTRMIIEINFRNLKMFHGLITSLPRSMDGYLANYIYSLLGYLV